MLPKIEACLSFVEGHPEREALITSLDGLDDALADKVGQLFVITKKKRSETEVTCDFVFEPAANNRPQCSFFGHWRPLLYCVFAFMKVT